MNLQNVPLFGLGNTGKSLPVNAQKRTNLYAEIQSDPEANGLVLYGTPGLVTFVNFGANPIRGLYARDGASVLYAVNAGTLWEVAPNGTMVSRGTLGTTGGRVDMIDNGQQLLIVDGTATGYVLTFATNAFATVTLPGAATNCTFLNGYGVVNESGSGKFYVSGSYNFATWDPLDFATAESDPDSLVRVIAETGQIVLFGEKTTEFWGDSGAADFPLARIGASAIQWGLAARWSLARFMNSLCFLGKNQLGAVQVFMLQGGGATPISNPELDYVLSTYPATADATAFSYMVSGHPMYCINFPTAGESWEYDGLTKEWHRRMSGTSGRYRGEFATGFLGKSYVADYENGKLYTLDQDAYTDDGTPIVREFISRHNKSGDFLRIAKLWLEMEAGVGTATGQGTDPQLMMQISRDGGKTWGAEVWRSIGKIGQNRARAVFNGLGRSRSWTFKFRVTDPVKVVFLAAWARYAK